MVPAQKATNSAKQESKIAPRRWKELACTNMQFSVGKLRNTRTHLSGGKHRFKSTLSLSVIPFCSPLFSSPLSRIKLKVESQVGAWCWQEVKGFALGQHGTQHQVNLLWTSDHSQFSIPVVKQIVCRGCDTDKKTAITPPSNKPCDMYVRY